MTVPGYPLTVSRLTALLKEVVEDNFAQVLVEGEISNFSAPASGHFYFSLKDERAQLRVVMFRPQNRLLAFRPENGLHVVAAGRVSLYAQRGEIQMIADTLEPKGIGSLQVAFEQLKARLAAEGLFAVERKRPLPLFPRTVGVVTSGTGAAIRDILKVLRRREAGVRVVLRPVRVQGKGAASEIAEAIADLNRHGEAEVLIVGRGGGSLEDLWAFNEEVVARAIHGSERPVIAAVGHEVDFTIADFVADLRAPTPSAAAELVARSRMELESHMDHLVLRLGSGLRSRVEVLAEKVDGLRRRLRSPARELAWWRRREEDLDHRLRQAMLTRLREVESITTSLTVRLDNLSPLKVLDRGYAIVFSGESDTAVRDAGTLEKGDGVRIRFGRGRARATIDEVGE